MADGIVNFGLIQPEASGAFLRGFQGAQERNRLLAQQEQQNQLAALQLRQAQRGEEEALAQREAYKSADPVKALFAAGLGTQAIGAAKAMQEQRAAQVKQAKDVLDLTQASAARVMQNPNLEFARQVVTKLGQVTGQDMTTDLQELEAIGDNPIELKKWAAGHSLKASDMLTKFETQNLGGAVQRQGYDPVTGMPIGQAQVTKMVAQPADVEAQKVRIAQAGRPSINISTEKKYGEAFAGKLAESDIGMRDAAMKAPEMANTANRILDLTSKGQIFTGTGANIKLQLAKALNMAGATDSEKAANTEALIADMGESTLAAIKTSGLGSGQGFTDKDRQFLQDVKGGRITLEKATIQRLADLQHRAAEASAQKWNARVKQIPQTTLEGTGLTTEAIEVPKKFSGKQQLSPEDQQARDWANANPTDPRAAKIKQKLEAQYGQF